MSPRLLRRRTASTSGVRSILSMVSPPSTAGSASAAARLRMASLRGRITAKRQNEPARAMNPPSSSGSRPARTSEDFPLPDVPTTPTKRCRSSRATISLDWPSRPKNRCVSAASNGLRPGNGLTNAAVAVVTIPPLLQQPLEFLSGFRASHDHDIRRHIEIELRRALRRPDDDELATEWPIAAPAWRLLRFTQLAAHPRFACASPDDDDHVAAHQIRLVLFQQFFDRALHRRTRHHESQSGESSLKRLGVCAVDGIAHQVNRFRRVLRRAAVGRRNGASAQAVDEE